MFEDFKDKVFEPSQNEQPLSALLSPEILEKLKKEGIDPDNFTLKQLWPEVLDEDGNDLSLLSGAEWETLLLPIRAEAPRHQTGRRHDKANNRLQRK